MQGDFRLATLFGVEAFEQHRTRFGVVVQQAYSAVSVPRAQGVGLADGVVGGGLDLEYRGDRA